MGDVQHEPSPQKLQTLRRQQHHLGDFIIPQVAHTFQPRLHDLPVIPVDVLIVVQLLHRARGVRGIFHDGQRHVRLQCQQPSAAAGKGDDPVGQQKVLVADVQIVFFKLAHFVADVAVAPVQSAQGEHRPFFILE